jgi:S1-C subfamily serine protease
MRRPPAFAAWAAVAACLLAVGCGGTRVVTKTVTVTAPKAGSTAASPKAGSAAHETFERIPQIVKRLAPSIVTIFVQTAQGEATGSGVIWQPGGTIVTNNHVVEGAQRVQVLFATGGRVAAHVKATDPLYDLAVVTVGRKDLPAATFATRLPQVGELAIAMGSPLGFANTVTAGIVSALHRSIPSGGQAPSLVDLVQTDAPISPGNSGGALVNARGQVIGINVAYIPPEAHAVSIGFAIPAPTVLDDVRQLLAKGKALHAFLGVQPGEVTPEIARQFHLPVTSGAVVQKVVPGSAAVKAGLKQGDVIVRLAGSQVGSVEDLLAALRHHKPGDRVDVVVWRDGKKVALSVTLSGRAVG